MRIAASALGQMMDLESIYVGRPLLEHPIKIEIININSNEAIQQQIPKEYNQFVKNKWV